MLFWPAIIFTVYFWNGIFFTANSNKRTDRISNRYGHRQSNSNSNSSETTTNMKFSFFLCGTVFFLSTEVGSAFTPNSAPTIPGLGPTTRSSSSVNSRTASQNNSPAAPHPPEIPPRVDEQLSWDLMESQRRILLYEKEVEMLREQLELHQDELLDEQNRFRDETSKFNVEIKQLEARLVQRDHELAAAIAVHGKVVVDRETNSESTTRVVRFPLPPSSASTSLLSSPIVNTTKEKRVVPPAAEGDGRAKQDTGAAKNSNSDVGSVSSGRKWRIRYNTPNVEDRLDYDGMETPWAKEQRHNSIQASKINLILYENQQQQQQKQQQRPKDTDDDEDEDNDDEIDESHRRVNMRVDVM